MPDYDVIVCGGGPAGVTAALAAARNGANTLLVERYGFAGGYSTAALVYPWMSFHTMRGEQVLAGTAADLCVRSGLLPAQVELPRLQEALLHQGAII